MGDDDIKYVAARMICERKVIPNDDTCQINKRNMKQTLIKIASIE